MTLDETELRRMCRRCRLKLPSPTENERSAFCCRGCFRMHYAKRCIVCEKPKSNERRLVCSRPACRTEYAELKRYGVLGKWAERPKMSTDSSPVQEGSANPIKIGICEPVEVARAWHQVAGSVLSARQLQLVAVGGAEVLGKHPAHPGLSPDQYAAVRRDLERGRISRAAFEAWEAGPPKTTPGNTAQIGSTIPPVNIIGGYRFPGAPSIDLAGDDK